MWFISVQACSEDGARLDLSIVTLQQEVSVLEISLPRLESEKRAAVQARNFKVFLLFYP